MTVPPLIEIKDLRVLFHGDDGRTTHAVDRVGLSVANGGTLGLVGGSDCGKSVPSLAIMGLLSKHSADVAGSIQFDGFDLLEASDETLRDLRGNRLAMIFQEPMTSLNPSLTIGDQIIETILRHRGGTGRQARERAIELLRRVHIPSPEKRIDEYPHKLSGGMRQRVMIAMALACDPRLLIADEPTTALDVTLQAQILDLMRELKAASGAAIILITHDLGVVAEVCDEVAVMYAGAARSVFGRPTAYVKAVDGVSFTVEAGKTLALVGESGCGKSTVSRLVLRLIEPDAGTVRFEGRDLGALGTNALRAFRRDAQIIFQDPYASLNPRMTVSQILTEPLALHDLVPAARRRERVEELLRLVGLEPRFARRYPHEFSGGQRQRIAIARALAVEPKLIICDEPVSALDVSIRSQILNLLRDLQDRLGLAYIFVSHDLAVRSEERRVG